MGNIYDLAREITKYLSEYSEDVTEAVKKSVTDVGKEVNAEIKKYITFKQHRGKYVKSFKVTNTYDSKTKTVVTWHVANGEYRLTHLLENGHALRSGGRTRAFPHIKYGEELAKKRMEELAEEAITSVNRR